ncbi:heterokaryon incompatibility protein-domain-containing protein [Nemania sp. FL0031]|nr:heterokaryon incompatibility protein-domain-containing protein [Nemania sp. FL0031]
MGQSVSAEQPGAQKPPLFAYAALPSTASIRLVRLNPMSRCDDIISVSMETVDLNSETEYSCLSYTWGPPCTIFTSKEERDTTGPRNTQILINDAAFEIGSNAFDFLKVWQYVKDSGWLWIDAICINQSDPAERNSQVALMSRIFRHAQLVIVWLGPTDDFCVPALELMEEAVKAGMIGHSNLPPVWSSAWFNVYAFLQRSWFSRLWVIQEVIVAQELILLVGTRTISWETIVYAAEELHRRNLTNSIYSATSLEIHTTHDDLKHDVGELVQVDELLLSWGIERQLYSASCDPGSDEKIRGVEFILLLHELRENRRLISVREFGLFTEPLRVDKSALFLLQYMQRADCTDPRDRVYAFIDFLERGSVHLQNPSPLRKELLPDYTLTVPEVYTNMAWHMVLSVQHLDLLSFASGPENGLPGLPSWAPDWRNRESIAARVLRIHNEIAGDLPRASYWRGTSQTYAYSQLLQVEGKLFDIVADISAARKGRRSDSSYILWPAGELAMNTPLVSDQPLVSLSRLEILLKVLTLNSKERCCHKHALSRFYRMWLAECKRAKWEWESKGIERRAELQPILDIYEKGHNSLFQPLGNMVDWKAADIDLDEAPLEALQNGQFFGKMKILSRLQARSQDELPGDIRHLVTQMEAEVNSVMRAHPAAVAIRSAGRFDMQLGIPAEEVVPWSGDYDRLRKLHKRMTVFNTERNRMGNGPRAMRPGDEIWILSGAKVPIILRPTNQGRRKVVGEAYVYGIMQDNTISPLEGETQNIILE